MVRWKRSTPSAAAASDHDAAIATTAAAVPAGGGVAPTRQDKEEEAEWTAMFQRLNAFKKAKGHCQADQDASDPELAQWVMSQRRHFVAFNSGGNNSKYHYATACLTHDRVKKLQSLGLDLSASPVDLKPAPEQHEDEDTRDEAALVSRRKKKASEEEQQETRRPPKKRKKSFLVSEQPAVADTEPEQREASSPQEETAARRVSVEEEDLPRAGEEDLRDDVSPLVEKSVKGKGDTAWETLMNVAALVPPLPTATHASTPALVCASPTSTVSGGSPQQTKKVKSKYGDLEALSNAGCSYSSKYRAANNDVVPNQQRWEDMFLRLESYKQRNGHCRVPNRFPEDPSLGSWVATQRRYFKNKNLPMPEDRVRRLTELGFEWTTKDPRKVPWETRFQGLRSFKEKFGHCDVPHEWEECPQLGFWTANMRQQYRYKQLGKKSSLTDERIKLLNEVGFVWKMQGGRRKKSDPVARPNQSATLSPSSADGVVTMTNSPSSLAVASRPLVLDPMSSAHAAAAMSGVVSSGGVYIPPPSLPELKQRAGAPHHLPYYHYTANI